jgi:hypothetical protein
MTLTTVEKTNIATKTPRSIKSSLIMTILRCYLVILCIAVLNAYRITPWRNRWSKVSFKLLESIKNEELLQSLKTTTNECCDPNEKSLPQSTSDTFLADITLASVSEAEISDENIVKIVNLETSDEQTNALVWKCLGYRLDPATGQYNNDLVFPKWKSKYPSPPDLIGIRRIYDPAVDKPVRDANMNLMRSIPRDYKAGVKNLAYVGFKGYKLSELTPNKTRRAQVVNWLIYYREYLHGKTFDELVRLRESEGKKTEDEANLPSEVMFQKLRLDEKPSQAS